MTLLVSSEPTEVVLWYTCADVYPSLTVSSYAHSVSSARGSFTKSNVPLYFFFLPSGLFTSFH